MTSHLMFFRALLLGITGLLLGGVLRPAPAAADGEREIRVSPVVRAVERSRAAVVSIHTTQVIRPTLYGWMELPPVEGKGLGSGALFHPEGYVITNAHVVARASKVLVDVATDEGGSETHEAQTFAIDIPHDLAILRLLPLEGEQEGARTYPYLPMGRSDDLMLGETVIVLGNSFGIGISVTTGVIGGLHRVIRAPKEGPRSERGPREVRRAPDLPKLVEPGSREPVLDDFVQIDAAVNPGNSGGPLLDITGRWIGVNTAIWSRRRTGAEGIGFAIPIDQVRSLVGRAFKRRLLRGDWLGVDLEEGEDSAARVRYVFPKGPARASGLREDDVITSVNGVPAATLLDVRWNLAFLPYGASVRLGVRRPDRAAQAVEIRLLPVPTAVLSERHLGFVAEDVSEEAIREQQLALDAGVIVQAVRPDGPAARVGLEPGDVVMGLGTYLIRHSDDLLLFLQYVRPDDLVKVRVLRSTPMRSGRILRVEQEGQMLAE